MIRAYVSIRGSRSPRRVDRDASPGRFEPYVALALQRDQPVRFELSFAVDLDDNTTVILVREEAGRRMIVHKHLEPFEPNT